MSYQPFPISEFKTGLYNYLEPWIRPQDAFEPMVNAYIYRGTLNSRQGYTIFGTMYYANYSQRGTGNNTSLYSGILGTYPVIPGSVTLTVLTNVGIETYTDNGTGTLTGSLVGTGTINYTTGNYTVNTGTNTVPNANPLMFGWETAYPSGTNAQNIIMGVKNFINEDSDTTELVIMDTRRAALYNTGTMLFEPLNLVSQTLWIGDGVTTSITLDTQWTGLGPYTVTITDGTSTIVDNGRGGFPTSGNLLNTSTVNYSTGSIVLNITSANTATYTISFTLQGNYFSGNSSNFFNATNWKPTSEGTALMYMTNGFDPITCFDGTYLSRPCFSITQADQTSYIPDITTALDVKVYKNRLLLIRPTIYPNNFPDPQSIRYSALLNPTNFVADITGNGGEYSAPTSDWIQSATFLRDVLFISFTKSTWAFRFTNNGFDPFRFDRVNGSKSTNAPYGSVEYDERFTSMGGKGLIACDGVNVQRYDTKVIDQFLQINQNYFEQCFAQRFDTTNQTWMLYPSEEANATTSDTVLIYNFLEDTWATYDIPMSCLGTFYGVADKTWADFPNLTWAQAQFAWDSYLIEDLAPTLLGGSVDGSGNIYLLNDGPTDNGNPIVTTISTTRWNPFVGSGTQVQFGYIDFYYDINSQVMLTLNFYASNSTVSSATRTITLDGPGNSDKAMKRVMLGMTGEFLRMEITSPGGGLFKILGLVLWAKPAGRLTP